jgi:hypothetical protein
LCKKQALFVLSEIHISLEIVGSDCRVDGKGVGVSNAGTALKEMLWEI